MKLQLSVQNNVLKVVNTVREKKGKPASPKIGLKNLNERFLLITGKPVKSGFKDNKFEVELPLVPLGGI
ncbi:hypothetical protein D3C83_188950 [compost metagenome]